MENIKNIVIKLSKNKILDYIILIIIACIISIPLSKVLLIFGTHDGRIHFIRLKAVISSLSIHQFPPLIAPDLCMTSGYAMTLFYNPIVTYIPLFIFNLIKNYIFSMKLYAAICILISGITMYSFSYQITNKRRIALISAVLYMNVPYLLGNIYVRYAMGEFTALAFMPIVFMGLYNLINEDGKKHYLISIGAILVVLSHTITAIYLAGICLLCLIINIKKLKNKDIIKKLAINILFILIITMFFWAPIFEAKNSAEYGVFDDISMGTYGNYAFSKAIDIKTLFLGCEDEEQPILFIGIPTIILGILTIYTYRKVDKKYKKTYLVFNIFSLVLLFLTTKYFPWRYMPKIICEIQFPWRLLGYVGFFSSFICAINMNIVLDRITSKILIKLVTFVIFFIFIIIYSLYIINANIIKKDGSIIYEDLYVHFYDQETALILLNTEYLPTKLIIKEEKREYIKERVKSNGIVLCGKAEIVNEHEENLSLTMTILNANKDTEIEFPFIFYPGYEIELNEDGKITKLKPFESENGYVAVKIDKEIQNVELKVEYKGTILTKVSYIISFIGLIFFIVFIWFEKNKLSKTNEKEQKLLRGKI